MKIANILIAIAAAFFLAGCAHAPAAIEPAYSNAGLDAVGVAAPVAFPLGSGDRLGQRLFNSDEEATASAPLLIQTAGLDDLQN